MKWCFLLFGTVGVPCGGVILELQPLPHQCADKVPALGAVCTTEFHCALLCAHMCDDRYRSVLECSLQHLYVLCVQACRFVLRRVFLHCTSHGCVISLKIVLVIESNHTVPFDGNHFPPPQVLELTILSSHLSSAQVRKRIPARGMPRLSSGADQWASCCPWAVFFLA